MSFYSDIYAANGSPVLELSQFFYGHTPETANIFDTRSNFIASQESAGIKMGVGDSDLFGYETLGKTLGETAEGKAKLAGGTDLQFIQKMYAVIFGHVRLPPRSRISKRRSTTSRAFTQQTA